MRTTGLADRFRLLKGSIQYRRLLLFSVASPGKLPRLTGIRFDLFFRTDLFKVPGIAFVSPCTVDLPFARTCLLGRHINFLAEKLFFRLDAELAAFDSKFNPHRLHEHFHVVPGLLFGGWRSQQVGRVIGDDDLTASVFVKRSAQTADRRSVL